MKKIKVVHICSSLDGGAGLCAARIMRYTSILNIDNFALVKSGTKNDYVDIIETKKAKCRIIHFIQKILHHLHLWPRACKISYKIEKGRQNQDIYGLFTSPITEYRISEHPWISDADIIHIHWVGGFLDYKSFFNNIKKPIVWTMHDENAGLGGFHFTLWKKMSSKKGQEMDESMTLVKKEAYNHVMSMHLVAISSMMKDFICHNNLLKDFPCTLIHNGIDENLFVLIDKELAREALAIDKERLVFIFVAYNIEDDRKGLNVLLSVLDSLNIQNTTLICLGHHTIIPQVTYEIRCEGIVNNTRLLSLYYSAADLFIMPSYQEAFAQTPLESMACGTPVVAFPCSGITDIIKPFNGIACSDFTPEALLEGIKKALDRQFNRNEIRKYVVDNFSYRKIAKQYVELYKTILENENK